MFWGGKNVKAGIGIARGHIVGHTTGKDYVKGAYAGLGAGITFGNATSNDQLRGPFDTTSWNFFFLSIQIAKSGDIWQESITAGPGAVGVLSRYDTDTKILGGEAKGANSGSNAANSSTTSNGHGGSNASNGSGQSPLFGQTVRMQGTRICPKDSSGQQQNSC